MGNVNICANILEKMRGLIGWSMSSNHQRQKVLYYIGVILVLVLSMVILMYKSIQMKTAIRCLINGTCYEYVGVCLQYNEQEKISKTKNVQCSFLLGNDITLKLYGGCFQSDNMILEQLRESETSSYRYQYAYIKVWGTVNYWVTGVFKEDKAIVDSSLCADYYQHGVVLYRILAIGILNFIGFLVICWSCGRIMYPVHKAQKTRKGK